MSNRSTLDPSLDRFIRDMPKVELHVHMEGAVRPETLLDLAQHHHISIPARSLEEVRNWYQFTDFPHFVEVYSALSQCIRSPEDIERIAREFFEDQAAQNIRYTEFTYTNFTHFLQKGISYDEQLAALNQARQWAAQEMGIRSKVIIDIPREIETDQGILVAEWTVGAVQDGVAALGLGGYEPPHPPAKHAPAFAIAERAGLPAVVHAGETGGADSIRDALHLLKAVRIGHGVRCLEDPVLVEELRWRQIPLEVCPTSNLCLNVAPDLAHHPLPRLLEEGLYVTLNSDDPALFNTTLIDEFLLTSAAFGFDEKQLEMLVMNALRASLLDPEEKTAMESEFRREFEQLKH
jgi:adenosine deaminase